MTKSPGSGVLRNKRPQGRSYFLDPYGCVKNQVDAETIMALLNKSGWTSLPEPDGADLIIINSCGFIESAKKESLNAVFSYRKAYPGKKILLAGCLAQRYFAELSRELPEADMLFGNADLSRIGEAAENALNGIPAEARGEKIKIIDRAKFLGKRPLLSMPGSAYVKISEGCDNRCAFCAIPSIRGRLRSRSVDSVLEECTLLLSRGMKELCLVGQDLGSYGNDAGTNGGDGNVSPRLSELLRRLSGLEGTFWTRLLYIHPDHFPLSLLDLFRRDDRLLPYFDLPFQHASPTLLRAMNRKGGASAYLSLIDAIRSALPDAVIRSTFMVGFPGEKEEDFEALLDFQEKAALDWLGVFAYSREEDTPAYSLKERVPKKTAALRKKMLEERQIPISEKRADRFVGRSLETLVEEELGEGLYLGRLACHAPEVDGAAVIESGRVLKTGAFVSGRVFERAGFDLRVRV